jgi:hypothetical protein
MPGAVVVVVEPVVAVARAATADRQQKAAIGLGDEVRIRG